MTELATESLASLDDAAIDNDAAAETRADDGRDDVATVSPKMEKCPQSAPAFPSFR